MKPTGSRPEAAGVVSTVELQRVGYCEKFEGDSKPYWLKQAWGCKSSLQPPISFLVPLFCAAQELQGVFETGETTRPRR